mmetsp:Transcript_12847/g.36675  ORF Transcript_12847/g.36675 Transcript_12847/m.36675 type:complete len:279 (-) Transcript_12847:543-1379(-)
MQPFNHNFDEEYMADVVKSVQRSVGCFACNNPTAKLRCTRCRVAVYCNKKCQLDGWKNCKHKETCKVYTDNRSTKHTDIAEPVPICLKSCGWLGENDLNTTMDRRVELFLAELQRWAKTNEDKGDHRRSVNVHLQASVVWNLGRARLQCAVTFYDFAKDGVAEVTGLVFHPVDEGDAAKRNLNPPSGGSGILSEEAKAKVLDKITWFVETAREFDVEVSGLTYGRGLMWMSDDSFKESASMKKWEEVGRGGKKLAMMPDSRYVMADAHNTAMGAGSKE